MNKEEKEVLNKVLNHPTGLLSQSDWLNILPNRDTRVGHSLITSGFVEEVTRLVKVTQIEATFYRITEKGRNALKPFYKRFWISIKGDLRTITVSAITSLVTTAIGIWLAK
ncbi:MAG: hypothetical protein WC767_01100 [Candidatus Paceibacterota bacterium]|jgi:hypothetical protein